jgi:hypothetical protein
LTVTKHITLEMENYSSSCVYLLPRGVFQYVTDGEMKPWGQTELEKNHNSIWVISWNCINSVAILYMCYFKTLKTWFTLFLCSYTMSPRAWERQTLLNCEVTGT